MILGHHGRFARVDLGPRVSGSGFEALVDSHAAWRIASVPVFVSLQLVVEELERYLAIYVITDQFPATKSDEDHEGQLCIARLRHA